VAGSDTPQTPSPQNPQSYGQELLFSLPSQVPLPQMPRQSVGHVRGDSFGEHTASPQNAQSWWHEYTSSDDPHVPSPQKPQSYVHVNPDSPESHSPFPQ
jgi:hypothetical protein